MNKGTFYEREHIWTIASRSFNNHYAYQVNHRFEDLPISHKEKMIKIVEGRLLGGDGDKRFNKTIDKYRGS